MAKANRYRRSYIRPPARRHLPEFVCYQQPLVHFVAVMCSKSTGAIPAQARVSVLEKGSVNKYCGGKGSTEPAQRRALLPTIEKCLRGRRCSESPPGQLTGKARFLTPLGYAVFPYGGQFLTFRQPGYIMRKQIRVLEQQDPPVFSAGRR